MKAIVTGAAGFIGSTLCEAILERGGSVVGIDSFTDYYDRRLKERNLTNSRENSRFSLLEEDIRLSEWGELLEDIDIVFHQAAQAGVRASWGEEFSLYTDWNILGTQKLLEAVRKLPKEKRPRLVMASSSSVYGERTDFPFYETDMPQPLSPYGVSKLAAEHLGVLYHRNFGVETISLRYFTVYGPRQRPDMAFHKFLRAIHGGREIPVYGDGTQTRDFTFISDAVEANLAAAENGLPGAVYNVGGGSRVTMRHCFEVLETVTGKPVKIEYLERQYGDVTHTAADTSKANREMKWQPKVSLEEGLRRENDYVLDLLKEGL